MRDTGCERMAKDLVNVLRTLSEQYALVAIYAFGSRADEVAARVAGRAVDSAHSDSDVDIGVLPIRGHRLTARDRVRIAIALEDALDVNRVDLVVASEANPFLASDIVCGELLYTSDADAEAEFQLYALRRVADLAPWERERRRLILAGEAY